MKTKWFLMIAVVVLLVTFGAVQVNEAKAATERNITLYGSRYGSLAGWGFTAASISSPGPTITVEQGDIINLTLVSSDGHTHHFFVSYSNQSSPGTGDPQSSDFSGTLNYAFTVTSTVGTYRYACIYHPDVMWGYLQVVPTGTIPEFQPLVALSLLVAATFATAFIYKRKHQT